MYNNEVLDHVVAKSCLWTSMAKYGQAFCQVCVQLNPN